jgi:Tol biopolymer transport system component
VTQRIALIWQSLIVCLAFSLVSCQDLQSFVAPPQVVGGGINSRFADEHPAFSSDGQYLAFASDRTYSRNIYLYNLRQKQFVELPNLNRLNSSQDQPSLSANGRYIAYVSTERGRPDVFVYDRQTQQSQLLTLTVRGSVRSPSISGDGRFVAYESSRFGQWHIEIYDRTPQAKAGN